MSLLSLSDYHIAPEMNFFKQMFITNHSFAELKFDFLEILIIGRALDQKTKQRETQVPSSSSQAKPMSMFPFTSSLLAMPNHTSIQSQLKMPYPQYPHFIYFTIVTYCLVSINLLVCLFFSYFQASYSLSI